MFCRAAQWDGTQQSLAGASAGAGGAGGTAETSSRLDLTVDSSAAAFLWLRRVRDELSLLLKNLEHPQYQFVGSPMQVHEEKNLIIFWTSLCCVLARHTAQPEWIISSAGKHRTDSGAAGSTRISR